jgi:hypothetical protein
LFDDGWMEGRKDGRWRNKEGLPAAGVEGEGGEKK